MCKQELINPHLATREKIAKKAYEEGITYIVSAFSSYGIPSRRQTEGDVQVHHGGGNMPGKGREGAAVIFTRRS